MTYAPPRLRPRRRWGLRLLIALLVLIGLLVAADRISLAVAERMAADTLQRSQQLPHRPDVSIDGFPFLTQLVGMTFDQIEVSVADATVGSGDRTVTLSKVHITLHDVHVFDDFHRATASSGSATALLSYAELSRVLHLKLSYAGAQRITASGSARVAGVSVSGSITAEPELDHDGALRFADPHVTVAGTGVPGAGDALVALLGPIPLTNLPFGLHVRGVAAHPDGVVVALTAGRLTFHR